MDYGDKANARHLLEILVSRDADILDDMMLDYADCVNALIESIWNHGIYEVSTQIMQTREISKRATDALEEMSHCYKTGDDLR